MAFEIDFMAVGEGQRSGDAIALRFGNLNGSRGEQTICIIDGGTKESGEALVDHINQYYGTNSVNFVFNSHPDSDHASGLTVVLEKMDCGTLVMHRPWEHSNDIHHLFDDGRVTPKSLAGRMERNLTAAHDLEKIALDMSIQIVEPFQGTKNDAGTIRVLGPSIDYYHSLLCNFRDMPELGAESTFTEFFKSLMDRAISWVDETLEVETLTDPQVDSVSAENNSSCIILFTIDDHKLLFTGDAGSDALILASDYAQSMGIALDDLYFLQVPHHGSKRNVGPTVLNRIKATTAFISAGKEAEPKHPSKRVTNALIRRGATICVTAGKGLLKRSPEHPMRAGWSAAPVVPFYWKVEED
jgi:beta-lactamase superfamily II metal-dependent hydrolase